MTSFSMPSGCSTKAKQVRFHKTIWSGFLKMRTHRILRRDPQNEILKAFRLLDDDETGKIS